jgi:hypothetical protein
MRDRFQQAGHMDASDPIKTYPIILQAGGRPHMDSDFHRNDDDEDAAAICLIRNTVTDDTAKPPS